MAKVWVYPEISLKVESDRFEGVGNFFIYPEIFESFRKSALGVESCEGV
jgi:hypothetical protein